MIQMRIRSVVLTVAALVCWSGAALAIDLSETSWNLESRQRSSTSRVGPLTQVGQTIVQLGPGVVSITGNPNDDVALAGDEFIYVDADGFWFTGTYLADDRRSRATLDPYQAIVSEYLISLAQLQAENRGVVFNPLAVSNIKPRLQLRAKATKTGVKVTLSGNVRGQVTGTDNDGKESNRRASVSIRGTGEVEIPLDGTAWLMDIRDSFRVRSLRDGGNDEDNVIIYFGPMASPVLAAGEFATMSLDDQDDGPGGTFAVDSRGRYILTFSEEDWEDIFEEWLIDLLFDDGVSFIPETITADVTSAPQMILKYKPETSISGRVAIRPDFTGTVDGAADSARGSYTLNVKATPYDP